MRRRPHPVGCGGGSFNADLSAKLKRAVSNGDTTAVRRLLKGGVECSSATFWFDGSLLHEAVASSSPTMVRMLLDAKAEVDACSKDGRTALHMACRSGQEELVQMLLNAGASVNALTKDRRSSLHLALWRGHEAVALCLMDHGANVNHRDEDGTAALHWAAKTTLLRSVIRLLELGADVNAADKHGRTALHEALSSTGNGLIVKSLLIHGADPNAAPKIAGMTTMKLVLRHRECDTNNLASMLLNAGYHLQPDDVIVTPTSQNWLRRVPETPSCVSWTLPVFWTHQSTVSTLTHLCRLCLRRSVAVGCRGRRFVGNLQHLPLPPLLKDFVAFSGEFALDIR